MASSTPLPGTSPQPTSTLLSLPPCLLPHLLSLLPYPDALALRHTHPYFFYSPLLSTDKNIRLKVSWLVERKARGLAVPMGHNLGFKTDQEFCGSREVRGIMEGRRRHEDCGRGEGQCEVVTGMVCEGRKWRGSRGRWVGLRKMGWEWVWSLFALVVAVGLWFLGSSGALENSMLYHRWSRGFGSAMSVS
ncbi:hypothetical protein MMC30_002090 [Trapelia coarctata]|nr:hypothetical protein [Trapelia coarctata]